MRTLILLITAQLVLAVFSANALAQGAKTVINGKISSFEESLPLEGATITIKDGTNITGSQADGTFSLEITEKDKLLIISLEGYQKQEVKLTGAREYTIILRRSGTLAFRPHKPYQTAR